MRSIRYGALLTVSMACALNEVEKLLLSAF